MSGPGFYLCAVLVVSSAAATVSLRPVRLTVIGAVAMTVSLGLLLLVAGAAELAIAAVLLLLGGLGVTVLVARRGGFGGQLATLPFGKWTLAAGVGGLALVVLDGTVLAGDDGWHRGGGSAASLVTLIHFRAPVTAGLLVVLGLLAVASALVIGRTSPDEEDWDRRRRARLEREQRMRRRREDRVAARQRRGTGRSGGG